jgi:hypothetical protein
MKYELRYLTYHNGMRSWHYNYQLIPQRAIENLIILKPRAIYFKDVVPLDYEHARAHAKENSVALFVCMPSLGVRLATLENMLEMKAHLLTHTK